MPQIVVDEESARVIEESLIVEVRDPHGRLLGLVARDLVEDFEIAKQRLAIPGRLLTTDEALERLGQRKPGE
uniref:Uncharacterized protein n=1 Tax=Schlesneria paludicola TaxID=360056 RepID=A0A7C2P8K7_9PLAN